MNASKTKAAPPARGARAARSGTGRTPDLAPVDGSETLQQCVWRNLEQYFVALEGAQPHALYEMVTAAVERPLLEFAMQRAAGNQSAAAALLGINRNTLRKRLLQHGLADQEQA